MNRELPPLKMDLSNNSAVFWGFSWLPDLNEFDSDGLKDGKTFSFSDSVYM